MLQQLAEHLFFMEMVLVVLAMLLLERVFHLPRVRLLLLVVAVEHPLV